jgi:hypothetical protein
MVVLLFLLKQDREIREAGRSRRIDRQRRVEDTSFGQHHMHGFCPSHVLGDFVAEADKVQPGKQAFAAAEDNGRNGEM